MYVSLEPKFWKYQYLLTYLENYFLNLHPAYGAYSVTGQHNTPRQACEVWLNLTIRFAAAFEMVSPWNSLLLRLAGLQIGAMLRISCIGTVFSHARVSNVSRPSLSLSNIADLFIRGRIILPTLVYSVWYMRMHGMELFKKVFQFPWSAAVALA